MSSYSMDKVVYFIAIVYATVAMIHKALNYNVLIHVSHGILVLISSFLLTIIVRGLHLSFCLCGLPTMRSGLRSCL